MSEFFEDDEKIDPEYNFEMSEKEKLAILNAINNLPDENGPLPDPVWQLELTPEEITAIENAANNLPSENDVMPMPNYSIPELSLISIFNTKLDF